ncbi:MAG: ABC transporter substrate-binding protein [Desulfobacterales bacterium]|jgi:peptide/nickel transport system substrate-binding protein
MSERKIGRRQFLKETGALVGGSLIAGPGMVFAQGQPGAKVDSMELMTTTATFDPVRPESARLICQEFEKLGWDVEPLPIDYKQNVQKVIMEHEYDMWLVRFTGASIRIDPNVFIYQVHHSSQYKKGGYNWIGYSNPEVDKLAEAQQIEMDVDKRCDLVKKAQVLIHEEQPENVLVNAKMTNAYRSDRLKNLTPMMGEGIGSFWSDIDMEVVQGDGYVRSGVTAALKNLNPIDVKDGKEFKELRMFYDRLFRIASDGQAKPWAAKSYSIPDPRTIDITIREGMLFHDGQPVTAEDIKFTFDYHAKWKAPFFAAALKDVESVAVTGKHSVRIKLVKPSAPFISNVLAAIFIIPQHIWKDIPDKVNVDDPLNYPNEKPIGSGPFKFEYWDRGRELKLSAFKEHFHPPKCAGNLMIVYGSHDAMAAAIEKGECDRTRYILKPSLMEDLDKVKGCVGKAYPSHGFYDLSYHTRRPPLNDPVFRKAIAHVLPKELIIEAVLGGHASLGGSVIAPANEFWHNPAVKPFPTDIRIAKKILAEAGYTWDNKGKLHYPKA